MLSFRPKASGRYLHRPRLLRHFPDEAGYVVWLEAPYGYGKSVLASQWAEALEAEGWRVLWLSLGEREPRAALGRLLDLPAETPWAVLLDALWEQKTLLVLEDLEGLADASSLTPLLKAPRGLLLLASRNHLSSPELPRLMTEGRLIHLQADVLAFSEAEAEALFDDAARARATRERAQGWPLPLHFAALTGELPESRALLAGLRESLSPRAWAEALLLAALPYLPHEAASSDTQALAQSGFVQALESGFRLHPLAGDALLATHGDELRHVVAAQGQRLPPLLRGLAFERADMRSSLGELLEVSGAELERLDPDTVLRWDALAAQSAQPARDVAVGNALCMRGRRQEGLGRLLRAAERAEAAVELRLKAFADAAYYLAPEEPGRARALAEQAEPLLAHAEPERVGRFLSTCSYIDYCAGNYAAARQLVERALEHIPPRSPHRYGSLINLAILNWNLTGDLEGRLRLQQEGLAICRQHYPDHVAAACRDLGRLHLFLGETSEAERYLDEARRFARTAPQAGLEAEALLAHLRRDPRPFASLLAQARRWEDAYTTDIVGGYWLATLHTLGDLEQAERLFSPADLGGFGKVALALVSVAADNPDKAAALLEEAESAYPNREYRLHWQAARYRLTRRASDLNALLALTTAHERILPFFLPLEALPREQPHLARAYPLPDVLASGWTDAIRLRQAEIPPLHVRVLGTLELRVLGEAAELTERHKAILTLLLLRQSREEIGAALWTELDAKKTRNNLNVQLNLLRRLTEPWNVSTYLFEDGLKRTEADLWALERALDARDAERVLNLYRHPLAPGLDVPVINEARERLAQEVTALLFAAAETAPAERAGAYLERVLELEPLSEDALQRLLRLLLARGRRYEAQRRYDAFAQQLKDELGLEPLPETRALL